MNHPFAQLQDFFVLVCKLGAGGWALRLRVICWRCSMTAGRYMCLVLCTPCPPSGIQQGAGVSRFPSCCLSGMHLVPFHRSGIKERKEKRMKRKRDASSCESQMIRTCVHFKVTVCTSGWVECSLLVQLFKAFWSLF